jgi:hypothetical protein
MRTQRIETRFAVWERELRVRLAFQEALSSDVVHCTSNNKDSELSGNNAVLPLCSQTGYYNKWFQCTTPRLLFLAAEIIHVSSAILLTQFLWK